VTDQTNINHIEHGGIEGLLSCPEEWDWRDVRTYILPMLQGSIDTLTHYHEEISRHANQQGKGLAVENCHERKQDQ
jgi:hypothetical protein